MGPRDMRECIAEAPSLCMRHMGEDLERFCVWRLPSGVRRNEREIRERSSTDTWRETGEVVSIVVSVRTIRQLGEVRRGI
jgi:hypothetical protein